MGAFDTDRQLDAARGELHAFGREPQVVARAIEAALAVSVDDRAWALIRLGADLRALGRPATALKVLDAAWSLHPSREPELAMFTSAIAAHCDLGQHETGRLLERDWRHRSVDLRFARVAIRLYAELAQGSDDDEDDDARRRYVALAAELEPS